MGVKIITGPQGSGKGTQSELLVKNLDMLHISVGQLLREEVAKNSEIGREVKNIIDSGKLVPDELTLDIVKNILEKNKDKNILLDGFPRNLNQAKKLIEILDELDIKDIELINLDIPKDESIRRLLKRAKIESRADDNEESIKNRLDIYYSETIPVINYFKSMGIKIYDIDGMGLVENIQGDILDKLERIS